MDPRKVAGVRGRIPSYPEQFPLWRELGKYLSEKQIQTAGACLTLYYSEEPDIDAEVGEAVAREYPDAGNVKFHTLPAVPQAACVVHHGPFVTIGGAYGFITKWIESNGYECIGPVREMYLREAKAGGEGANPNDPETVAEIQFPVTKK
ncbi:MAG: GyrI-like domain-containing protein [Anaerolineales bacterium]